jgi:hypothetical protein
VPLCHKYEAYVLLIIFLHHAGTVDTNCCIVSHFFFSIDAASRSAFGGSW